MNSTFLNELRRALNNLYDLNSLRSSPLCRNFRLDNPYEAPIRLQRILEDAIGDLRPQNRKNQPAHARETYELLSLRYLQQFSQKEVADQLGVSLSQMNRIQQKALEDLAAFLYQKYALVEIEAPLEEPVAESPPPGDPPGDLSADLTWTAVPSKEKSALLEPHLARVAAILRPVLERYPVELHLPPLEAPAEVLVYPAALRQILLTLLTSAAQLLSSGTMRVTIRGEKGAVVLGLRAESSASALAPLSEDIRTNLDIAHNLVRLSGGTFEIKFEGQSVSAVLHLPQRASIPILIVDDSREILDLMARYTLDTPYQAIATDDPQQAITLAGSHRVRVIFLDVMMPRIDGWELLQKIRNHPLTAEIPVVICSIMRQEELAAALGASAYLRKPVNQEDLLALLDRLCGPSPAA